MAGKLYVVNRRGAHVPVRFDKITERNEMLCTAEYGKSLEEIDCPAITAMVIPHFRSGMTTSELDHLVVSICIEECFTHIQYGELAARILISDLHKKTEPSLLMTVQRIMDLSPSRESNRYSTEFIEIVKRASHMIDPVINHRRDYKLGLFGFKTLEKSYLLRPWSEDSEIPPKDFASERPQHLYMRVALCIYVCQPDGLGHEAPDDVFVHRVKQAISYYYLLSDQRVSHATPTLLNSGTTMQQLSSCFLISIPDDLKGQFKAASEIAAASKSGGGVAAALNLRASNSLIASTNGRSTGIRRYLRILNDTIIYVDQGGKRPGALAVTVPVDDAEIFVFLESGQVRGDKPVRGMEPSPDLKYALWVSDLFMETLLAELDGTGSGDWYLFNYKEAPELRTAFGDNYRKLYKELVKQKRYHSKIKASEIIAAAYKMWSITGTPYVMYKDAINSKTNMANVAPVTTSNLCCEITIPCWSQFEVPVFERFNPDNTAGETAVCNLAAICLGSFVENEQVDYERIAEAAGEATKALNRLIDRTLYPSKACRRSNQRHRPIGIGIMGLADVLAQLQLGYGGAAACNVARAIAAAILYGALNASCGEAEQEGAYSSFAGSPASAGLLQPDLWKLENWEKEVEDLTRGVITVEHWQDLRARIKQHGLRNAFVTAYMPTATTSNIVGQNESFESFTSNLYTRKTLAGEFLVTNPWLLKELTQLGLWDDEMRGEFLRAGGSIQSIERIPADVRRRYRTARELPPKAVINMAAAISPFVDQAISTNLFLAEPSLPKILRFLADGWRAGLKTGMYYCHTLPAAGAGDNGGATIVAKNTPANKETSFQCTDTVCTSCAL